MTEQRPREISLKDISSVEMSGEWVEEEKGSEDVDSGRAGADGGTRGNADESPAFTFDLSIRGHALQESIRQLFVAARESKRFRRLPPEEQLNKLEHEVTELVREDQRYRCCGWVFTWHDTTQMVLALLLVVYMISVQIVNELYKCQGGAAGGGGSVPSPSPVPAPSPS